MTMRKFVNGNVRRDGESGAALLELALLLPILVVLAFGVIDLGRLIHARLVVTNVSREGGSLASRGMDIQTGDNLIAMLQSSATPFNLQTQGRIYVTRIKAGETQADPLPYVDSRFQGGAYGVSSSIGGNVGQAPTGLSTTMYNHLRFEPAPQSTSDIAEITVVEVFYHYRPITPLPNFVQNLFPVNGGILIGSRAIF
jgi:Flp pilus assembly protein TadG